ncbi:hypothetical protein [Nonomuraea cavernae]|uniref:hypothetical protein n=1 Tax=Nonomuraea cavernae TaxID=2045107 RepID=UPI0034119645
MDAENGQTDGAWLARAQGACNVLGGVWPLAHMSSFEKVFGVKIDRWLVRTVAGLLVGIGYSQIRASGTPAGSA